ncbi:phenylalanine--tRNA ligase subunit beta [Candidatus Persebacteraceae bacterium Df01]|jgi:phenylalanyl-tRNA synthetase beta chain|uniref:Phenylalanine--tRNA ligase beta subunit n=1 Tax=Candidatus Doriopsillibacter californiensis TaxID=2970740 RepID=A0ABT7QLD1_9GAMM|nr:phenylalanine--tRNA ligase subunit beta [Candidatus Persebacteraceae bacterium Df01]
MKISRHWLQTFCTGPLPANAELAACLTNRGFEVDLYEPAAIADGLYAGRILEIAPHPNADNLNCCKVDVGDSKPLDIVCGAPNVATEVVVVVAKPGARIGNTILQKRDVRGVESNGMLCSAKELGVGIDGDGILLLDSEEIAVGELLNEYLHLSDTIFDISITPNRGDCLSHLGMVREVVAVANLPPPTIDNPHHADIDDTVAVRIDGGASEACPYYGCIVIRNVDARRPSPWWLRTLLERCGLRSISAAVDVTNYVMLALGQPLHAFDLDKIANSIRVRFADDDEKLTLLDGTKACCNTDTLLVADEQQGLALGGIMGGMSSMVSDTTTNILLEGAFFSPQVVRGRTRQYGINSEAAFRFERGVDRHIAPQGLALGARLIKQICGGQAGPLQSSGAGSTLVSNIVVSGAHIRSLIGVPDIDTTTAADYLSALSIPVNVNGDILTVSPPSWRFDLERDVDVVEEVARSWGYDKLPETTSTGNSKMLPQPPQPYTSTKMRRRLASLGFSEAITYAFVPLHWEKLLGQATPVQLQNPISEDMSVMRTTLLGGLLDRALFNQRRQRERLRLFEIGRCFFSNENDDWTHQQPLMLAGVVVGNMQAPQWAEKARAADFFDIKGWLEFLLRDCPGVRFEADRTHTTLHPYQAVRITADINDTTVVIGTAGVLHPAITAELGFTEAPLVFELSLQALNNIRQLPQAVAVSPLPLVRRDLSVTAAANLTAAQLLECIHKEATKLPIINISLFDCYESDNIKKCYGVRLHMQGTNANLTDNDINLALEKVVNALEKTGFSLRQEG